MTPTTALLGDREPVSVAAGAATVTLTAEAARVCDPLAPCKVMLL